MFSKEIDYIYMYIHRPLFQFRSQEHETHMEIFAKFQIVEFREKLDHPKGKHFIQMSWFSLCSDGK